MKEENECDCCGWDDCGHSHEPYCSSLTVSPMNNISETNNWNDKLRQQLISAAIHVEAAGMLYAEMEFEGFPYLITIKRTDYEHNTKHG